MSVNDRVLACLRTRFFLHIWEMHVDNMATRYPDLYSRERSFISTASHHIFKRSCDSLVLLVLAYASYYPNQLFCPWLIGTEFVEHFFGLARSLLPNFTYAELLKLLKHIMLRQHLILTGKVKATKERTSRSGYLFDYDATPLTQEELEQCRVSMPRSLLDKLVKLAHSEASQIAKQLLQRHGRNIIPASRRCHLRRPIIFVAVQRDIKPQLRFLLHVP